MISELEPFRNETLAEGLVKAIRRYNGRPVSIMEVCGTHTMAISRYGIRELLPPNVKLISGPGCPVCVTPSFYLKSALELCRRENTIVATFGDMMRIPYKGVSLLTEKALGRDIRMVYSPLDSLNIARQHPDKTVIFLSVGFETTVPVTAIAVLEAAQQGLDNFMILSANKTIPAAMHLLSSDPEVAVDGFLYPGHVSAVIGSGLYEELAKAYGIPGAVTGFDPADILGSILYVLEQIRDDKATVANLYSMVVQPGGNPIARGKIDEVFEPSDAVWRGLGQIPGSGLRLREKYRSFDAWSLINGSVEERDEEARGCRCGDILKGKCLPSDCKLFGKACMPETPVGSCMVSSEGTCAAYYRYQ
ncbi:hydrogenase formation protein HypD [Paenibacillus zanthoxyli]|uniref:hydrogenase formation protein HypD n=1 Tax=Paenibacillus zanthoxyli TaxID=369399 RepID=UPI000471B4AB|nr:hydrogenase formation protein HypD [Paenibacillus zanthoxyli]